MEREIVQSERVIRRELAVRIRKLILRTMIGARMEMAGGARYPAVATRLHIPEKSLTQDNQGVLVLHVTAEIGDFRNLD